MTNLVPHPITAYHNVNSDSMILGDYHFNILQGNEDVTQSIMLLLSKRTITFIDEVIPSHVNVSLNSTMNQLFAAFDNLDAKSVFSNQMNVLLSRKSRFGKSGYLMSYDGHPFISFTDAPHLAFPIGKGKYFDAMKAAPRIAKFMAAEQLRLLSEWDKSSKDINSLLVPEEALLKWYERENDKPAFAEEREAAIRRGFLDERAYLHRGISGLYSVKSQFPWVPALLSLSD